MTLLNHRVRSNLLDSNCLFHFKTHLGSKDIFRNNLLDEYVYGFDHLNNSIFNIEKTLVLIKRALSFIKLLKKDNHQILFVGTSAKTRNLIKFIARETPYPCIQQRWIKGLFTNWENISPSIRLYRLFLKKLSLTRKRKEDLVQTYDTLQNLKTFPSAVFLLDAHSEVVHEARKLNIPIIAFIENDSRLISFIDYPIVINKSSPLSPFFVISLILDILKK